MRNRYYEIHLCESSGATSHEFFKPSRRDRRYVNNISRAFTHRISFPPIFHAARREFPTNARFTTTVWRADATETRLRFLFGLSVDVRRALGIFYQQYSYCSRRARPPHAKARVFTLALCVHDPSLPTLIIPHSAAVNRIRSRARRSLLFLFLFPFFFQLARYAGAHGVESKINASRDCAFSRSPRSTFPRLRSP